MKTFILLSPILLTTALFSSELSWVDEQVEAIKPARIGMSKAELSRIKDPFIFLKKNRGEEDEKKVVASTEKPKKSVQKVMPQKVHTVQKVLELGAIMNKSVMISGVWYKLGDTVNGYKISDITLHSVLLVKNQKRLLLSTKSSNKNIKFQK